MAPVPTRPIPIPQQTQANSGFAPLWDGQDGQDGYTSIPADDATGCLVCGADTLGGGDYCATHWPKTVKRPGYVMPEATCAHHVEPSTARHCDGCGGKWTDLPDGVTAYRNDEYIVWDARRKQWTTQTTAQAN